MQFYLSGQEVRDLRRSWKVSQFELAMATGISTFQISYYERNLKSLSNQNLKAIYEYFVLRKFAGNPNKQTQHLKFQDLLQQLIIFTPTKEK